jgi:hypothetical protein
VGLLVSLAYNKKNIHNNSIVTNSLVRDSSAVQQLFVRLAGAVGSQCALHKEYSGFAAATLRRHISIGTFPHFVAIRFLFSIPNPYINRFTNHFSIHS